MTCDGWSPGGKVVHNVEHGIMSFPFWSRWLAQCGSVAANQKASSSSFELWNGKLSPHSLASAPIRCILACVHWAAPCALLFCVLFSSPAGSSQIWCNEVDHQGIVHGTPSLCWCFLYSLFVFMSCCLDTGWNRGSSLVCVHPRTCSHWVQ